MGRDSVVLVTGAGGQLGRALGPLLPHARLMTRDDLDVTKPEQVIKALEGVDVVFHLAAFTDVDRCEIEPEECWRVNAEGSRHIAEAMKARGRAILVSTDYVFDGMKTGEYEEDDPANPLNEYGRSKLAAEGWVLRSPVNLVVRTSWVIGEGRNFVRTILSAAQSRDRLQVVDDQRGRPTFSGPLARGLVRLNEAGATGIVHVSGDGPPTTWCGLAEAALGVAGITTPVDPVDTETFRRSAAKVVAQRPPNSVFSLRRAAELGVELHDWRASLAAYLEVPS